ncbi:MAG: hypothetical protein V4633_08860 [Pseudomonadota bacterium]
MATQNSNGSLLLCRVTTGSSFRPVSGEQVDGGRSFYTALGHLPAT